MDTRIVEGASLTTMINLFKVAPERQQDALDILVEATDQHIRHRPGFISANLHVSEDGTRIVNYTQWKDPGSLEAMIADPACRHHIDAVAEFTEPDFRLYRVHSVHRND
jgi:quinol monooxygenase YgiN